MRHLLALLLINFTACSSVGDGYESEVPEKHPLATPEDGSETIIGIHEADEQHLVKVEFISGEDALPIRLRIQNYYYEPVVAKLVLETTSTKTHTMQRSVSLPVQGVAEVEITSKQLGLLDHTKSAIDLVTLVDIFSATSPDKKLDTYVAAPRQITFDTGVFRSSQLDAQRQRLATRADELQLEEGYELEMDRFVEEEK